MNRPLVSICIPVYNAENYIQHTLESLVIQTYKNIEIIVSDNASTDHTRQSVMRVSARDTRIKYFCNETNVGYCKNVLSAVRYAASEYVAIYHADDIYDPKIIEEEVDVLLSDKDIVGVFTKLVYYYGENGSRTPNIYKKLMTENIYSPEDELFRGDWNLVCPLILKYGNFFPCPSLMTRKDHFIKIGGFSDNYPSNEDLELWIKMLQSGNKLAIVNQFLLKYRISHDHASAYWNKCPELGVVYKVIDEMIVPAYKMTVSDSLAYAQNKAIGYIIAGNNAYRQQDFLRTIQHFQSSIREYRYPIWSKIGIAQRLPMLACRINSWISAIKNVSFF